MDKSAKNEQKRTNFGKNENRQKINKKFLNFFVKSGFILLTSPIINGIIFKHYELVQLGGIAQLGEHLPCKQGVSGSIPLISTRYPLIMRIYIGC